MAIDQFSNSKPLTVLASVADDDAGWRFVVADLQNSGVEIVTLNVAQGDWHQVFNDVGDGSILVPASDPLISLLIDNDAATRHNVMVRAYMDGIFRYGFYLDDAKDVYSDDGGRMVRFHGEGMEAIADDMKIRPYDHPASPSVQSDWSYGNTANNLVSNPTFDAGDIITNSHGQDGNDSNGRAVGWQVRGSADETAALYNVSNSYLADGWFIRVDPDERKAGIEQSIPCIPNSVVHVQVRVKDSAATAQRLTLALGGAEDITATGSYPNNFEEDDQILAELGNVATPGGRTDGTWQVLDVEALTGANQTSLLIAIQNDHYAGLGGLDASYPEFWVGDVQVVGLGLGIDPWRPFDKSAHHYESLLRQDPVVGGFDGLWLYINPTTLYAGVDQFVPVAKNGNYRATCVVYTPGYTAGDAIKLEIDNLSDTVIIASQEQTYTAGGFTTFSVDFQANAEDTHVIFRVVYSGTNDPAAFYLLNPAILIGSEAKPPGGILTDLITPIQARGTAAHLVTTFTATHDSAGKPWLTNLSLDIAPGSSILDILRRMVALGYEWEIVPVNYAEGGDTGMSLNVYNTRALDPDSGVGNDWTVSDDDAPVILPGEGLTAGDLRSATRRPNVVYVHGANGAWTEVTQRNFASYDERVEAHIDVSDVSDQATLTSFGRAFLDDELSREFGFRLNFTRSATLRPYRDFGVGDSLYADLPGHRPDPDRTSPRRVRAITVKAAGEGADVTYTVDFDRVVRSDEQALYNLVAQLAERSPTDTGGSGAGRVTATGSSGSSQVIVSEAGSHQHTMVSLTERSLAGDVLGQLGSALTVAGIRGIPVLSGGITDGQVLVYDSAAKALLPGTAASEGLNVLMLGGM